MKRWPPKPYKQFELEEIAQLAATSEGLFTSAKAGFAKSERVTTFALSGGETAMLFLSPPGGAEAPVHEVALYIMESVGTPGTPFGPVSVLTGKGPIFFYNSLDNVELVNEACFPYALENRNLIWFTTHLPSRTEKLFQAHDPFFFLPAASDEVVSGLHAKIGAIRRYVDNIDPNNLAPIPLCMGCHDGNVKHLFEHVSRGEASQFILESFTNFHPHYSPWEKEKRDRLLYALLEMLVENGKFPVSLDIPMASRQYNASLDAFWKVSVPKDTGGPVPPPPSGFTTLHPAQGGQVVTSTHPSTHAESPSFGPWSETTAVTWDEPSASPDGGEVQEVQD